MTAHQVPTVQHGVEISVPLNKLKTSPRNARQTPHAKADIEALAASIVAKGILQPPVVEPERDSQGVETGIYFVSIGEGRRQALALLAKRKQIAKTALIRCLVDETNDAFEVSLDENVTRFAMHPADQFEAFRELAEHRGWSAEEIAVRFGVSAQVVRQRLRLGAVSPLLMEAYRAGELTLDQLMAFAVSEDHGRQEQVFQGLSYNRSASLIRRLMTEHEVEANDRRARFVGPEAYEEAGGRIRRDLFSDDQGGWFEDAGLLDRLALEKLTAEAETVRQTEGWAWAEAHLDYPRDRGFRRVYPLPVEVDPATTAKLSALSEEYDALIGQCTDGEPLPEDAEARLREIEVELEAASQPVFSPDAYARAGVFVVLTWEGTVRIERGFIRPEHEEAGPEAPSDPDDPTAVEQEPERRTGGPKPLGDRLVADLTAHRTAALRDVLASDPNTALVAALHTLALQTFYSRRGDTCLELSAGMTELDGFADGYAESLAGRNINARHEGWAARLPDDPNGLWESLLALSEAERMNLFAHCVSLTMNAVEAIGRPRRALADAERLARHVELDMSRYWHATAESYFGRISKAQILHAVMEAKSSEAAAKLEGLKKDAMAKAAADLLGTEGWLPPLFKYAAANPA